jgi:hypothetical protein
MQHPETQHRGLYAAASHPIHKDGGPYLRLPPSTGLALWTPLRLLKVMGLGHVCNLCMQHRVIQLICSTKSSGSEEQRIVPAPPALHGLSLVDALEALEGDGTHGRVDVRVQHRRRLTPVRTTHHTISSVSSSALQCHHRRHHRHHHHSISIVVVSHLCAPPATPGWWSADGATKLGSRPQPLARSMCLCWS